MNFAITYTNKFPYMQNENVEFNINYKPKVKSLDNFISQYGDKHRINLIFKKDTFQEERDIPIIKALLEKYTDYEIVVRLPYYTQELEQILVKNEVPHYYFDLISSWDTLKGFLSLDVTDIYIIEDLCFNYGNVRFLLKNSNKKLRTFCNICQSSWKGAESIKTFFIRPEDVGLYEPFFDTLEFVPLVKDNPLTESVLYDVYSNKRKWTGQLKEIIADYKGEQDSRCFLPIFANQRLNCGHRCSYSSCQLCTHIAAAALTMNQHDIAIIEKMKKQ